MSTYVILPEMPRRNVNKEYVPESYYHIYNRGVNKANIFLDRRDYLTFVGLLKRYLGADQLCRVDHTPYPNFKNQVELLAFCLMPNHFHLFIYQVEAEAIKALMKSLGVAYSMYFNKRYNRLGPVFQQTYKAVRITDQDQLLHITRYIHLNPKNYLTYEWTSLPYYQSKKKASWLQPGRVQELFEPDNYLQFLEEYTDRRTELKSFKEKLADA